MIDKDIIEEMAQKMQDWWAGAAHDLLLDEYGKIDESMTLKGSELAPMAIDCCLNGEDWFNWRCMTEEEQQLAKEKAFDPDEDYCY